MNPIETQDILSEDTTPASDNDSTRLVPVASSGDYECGELIGEYTLELKNEAAHGLIRDLSTS